MHINAYLFRGEIVFEIVGIRVDEHGAMIVCYTFGDFVSCSRYLLKEY